MINLYREDDAYGGGLDDWAECVMKINTLSLSKTFCNKMIFVSIDGPIYILLIPKIHLQDTIFLVD